MEKIFIRHDNAILLPFFKKITLTLSIIVLASFSILAQTSPASRQVARPKGTTGSYFGYYEYLPSNYSSASKLPVVIFFHGIGEAGNGTTDLSKVLRNGPPKEVQYGKDYPFILISPQHNSGWWNTIGVDLMLEHIKKNYKVDLDRIYITGLSAGGYGTWVAGQGFASELAAIVPICGCGNDTQASNMVNLPIWAFHNSGDPTVKASCSTIMVDAVKKAGGSPKLTIYQSSSHDAWTATYKSQEMWDWLLAQRRSGSITEPSPNKVPVANAGSDVSITLPTNSVTLKGTASDSDGSISKYSWTKISGPAAILTNTTTSTLTASDLITGSYIFRLTATDNDNASDYDDVTVIVGETTPVGSNLALKKPVVTSSISNVTYVGANAVDGNTSSRWSSSYSDYQWMYVDLGAIYNIERVKILWEVAHGKDYQIQVSSNASTWETIKTVSGNTSLTNDLSGLSGTGRYVRMLGIHRGTRYGYSIFEFQVYGPSGNTNPVVNAGSNVSITLPENSVTLNGTATDQDGSISTYSWTKLSGPNATLTNSNTSTLTASGLASGNYVFRLTATDNNNASDYDDVMVTVEEEITTAPNPTPTINLALKRPVTTSSVSSVNYQGYKAVDGSTSSRWSSSYSDYQWLSVDLGAVYDIERVKINWEVALGKDYQIQVSSNASSWETIKTVSGNTSTNNDLSGLSGSGRYVRILGIHRGTRYGYSIFEFQVFGSSNVSARIAPDEADMTREVESVVAYPNPMTESNMITLDFANAVEGNITCTLMDQIGTSYLTQRDFLSTPVQKYTVDLSKVKLGPGIYFLKIRNENQKDKVLKIIKR